MNLDVFHNFVQLLAITLAFGRTDLALEFASVMLVGVAADTEAAGLYYGPRYPA